MKAAVCREHGRPLTIEDVEVGPPGSDEVRVNIAASAICHSDITYAAGEWGGETPAIYGHEAAGLIESVGRNVTGVGPGDHVIVGLLRTCGECFHCRLGEDNLCIGEFEDRSPFVGAAGEMIVRGLKTGAFAEQTVVHHSQVVPVPKDVPFTSASLLACSVLTGFGAVMNTAQIPPGSTAAVIGVGGVGLGAVQGAGYAGASQVIAVDLVDAKLKAATSLGATSTINATDTDAIEAARALTGGVGPDYVFVTVGASPAIDQGLGMVRRGGSVVLVGMPGSGVMTEFEAVGFSDASQRILGSKMGSSRLAVDVPKLIGLYRSGSLKLDEMISNMYPLDQINDAIDEVIASRVLRNVIVFDR